MSRYEQHARVLMISEVLDCRVDKMICDECQAECYSVQVLVRAVYGTEEHQWIGFREHMAHWSEAIRHLVRVLGRLGHHVQELEVQQYVLEHQLSLELD